MSITNGYIPNYKRKFFEEVVPYFVKELGYGNALAVPRLHKIVINSGVGKATADSRLIQYVINDITLIAGQRAVPTHARKSIAGFKLKQGMPIGVRVTLRGNRMWSFYERFICIALPRTKDFRGISRKSIDKFGNITIGIEEQTVFVEIDPDKVEHVFGMDVTIVTTARDSNEAYNLLKSLDFPFND